MGYAVIANFTKKDVYDVDILYTSDWIFLPNLLIMFSSNFMA